MDLVWWIVAGLSGALGLSAYHNYCLRKQIDAFRERYDGKLGELAEERTCRVEAEAIARSKGIERADGELVDVSQWPIADQLRLHARSLSSRVQDAVGAS